MRIIGNDPSTPRQAQVVASGTLSTGDAVVVNSDGTVSVVEETSTSAGSEAVFTTSPQPAFNATVFDSNSNKIVIAYRDNGNSGYGTAVVGTVSGTSISFGTPVVFESADTRYVDAVFDSINNKVVIAYSDWGNSEYFTGIVGTVSGASISFGSPTVGPNEGAASRITSCFDTANGKVVFAFMYGNLSDGVSIVGTVSGTSISFGSNATITTDNATSYDAAYDVNAGKVVVVYKNDENLDYGTAAVGTVSGTSISYGTPVVFKSSSINEPNVSYDSASNKIALVFRDDSNQGVGVVGTVSGTSISFGSETIFNSSTTSVVSISYDSNANKHLVSYKDGGNSNYGTAAPASISGTSISFESSVVFNNTGSTNEINSGFDSNAGKCVISYRDDANSNYGAAVVFTIGSNNLTAENYIGTAATGAADTQRAKINLKGAVADVPATGYVLSSASYDSVSFSVASQETTPQSVAFNNTGTKMYVVGSISDNVHQYSLSSAYDLSSASYDSVSLNVQSQDSSPTGIAFSSDGTKLYMLGFGSQSVHQYSLSSAFDLSTASYDSVSLNVFSQESTRQGLAFNASGSKMYVVGSGSDNVHQYSLSTNFDLSTATYDSVSFSVASQDANPVSMDFNSDGTKMYVAGNSSDSVYQYSLTTGYDVSTASYDSVSFSFANEDVAPLGITFSGDGSKMYMVGAVSHAVYQYSTSASLTAGQSYYVQTDGTLGTTPADPSVFAGTAVAANKLIVKG